MDTGKGKRGWRGATAGVEGRAWEPVPSPWNRSQGFGGGGRSCPLEVKEEIKVVTTWLARSFHLSPQSRYPLPRSCCTIWDFPCILQVRLDRIWAVDNILSSPSATSRNVENKRSSLQVHHLKIVCDTIIEDRNIPLKFGEDVSLNRFHSKQYSIHYIYIIPVLCWWDGHTASRTSFAIISNETLNQTLYPIAKRNLSFCCALRHAVLAHALDVNFWPRAWKNNTFVNILLSHPRAITVSLLSVRVYLVCVQSVSPVTQGVADYQANDVIKWAWRNPVLPFVLSMLSSTLDKWGQEPMSSVEEEWEWLNDQRIGYDLHKKLITWHSPK